MILTKNQLKPIQAKLDDLRGDVGKLMVLTMNDETRENQRDGVMKLRDQLMYANNALANLNAVCD